MKVPEGKTFYIGKKKLKAGDEIPPMLESSFAKILSKERKPVFSDKKIEAGKK